MHPEHRTYLGIHVPEEDGSVSFYVWRVMFLGISDAVFIFTALLKPVRSYIASLGIPVIFYLDDGLTGGKNKEIACSNNSKANEILGNAGWIVSMEKKQGPSQRILFLGLEICSVTFKFYIPEKKIDRLLCSIDSLLSSKKVKLRTFASFLGLLQSVGKALGPVVRLMSRRSYLFLMSNVNSYSWNFFMPLSEDVKSELSFWQRNLVSSNGYKFSASLSMIDFEKDVITDASGIGIFGYKFFASNYDIVLRRMLSEWEKKQNSTYREMLALHEIYTGEDAEQFSNSIVRHLLDNKAVVEILDHGSKSDILHAMAVAIFKNCRRLNITLFVEWRPRTDPLIVHADYGSRMFDQSSYSLNSESFMAMVEFFNISLDVDCMSDNWNRKCPVYFSRFPDPFCSGVNFFAQKLYPHLIYYCFPPPSLFTASVLHLQAAKVSGLVLVPLWKSASYWNNVCPDGRHLPAWVQEFLIFKPSGFVVDPNVISNTFKSKPVYFDMIALRVDFSGVDNKDIFFSLKSKKNCIEYGCIDCLQSFDV